MHRLIHEHATIVGPGSPPCRGVVVGLVPRPPQPDGTQHQASEPPLLQRLTGLDDGQVVAVLMHDEQLHAAYVAGFEHPIGILEFEGERLLHDDGPAVVG